MSDDREGTARAPLPPADSSVRNWAQQRRAVARTIREQAVEMRVRTAHLRLALEERRAAVVDTATLRRRLESSERRAGNLQAALASNRRIGIAIGILMARYRWTDEQAFDVLRECSNRWNVKLAAVAEDVVYTGDLHRVAV